MAEHAPPLALDPCLVRLRERGIALTDLGRQAPGATVAHVLDGVRTTFAQPCTFTPFASARPCSARCRFCSETLVEKGQRMLAAALRPGPAYRAQLARAFAALRPVPLGLSLSGLEATDDADFLALVLDEVEAHEREGGVWTDKVLYSNGNGLHPDGSGDRVLARLLRVGLSRVELSRHSQDDDANSGIMRFRPDALVGRANAFEQVARALAPRIHVRLVCVLQRGGVATLDDVARYLSWAASLGVRDVVFRELSRLGDRYVENEPWRYVRDARVKLGPLVDAVLPPHGPSPIAFAASLLTVGYYYWNVRGHVGDVEVTFETSDYTAMKALHARDVVRKLVLHANGDLCADWDPGSRVLLAADGARAPVASERNG